MSVETIGVRVSSPFVLGCCHSFASSEGIRIRKVKLSQVSSSSFLCTMLEREFIRSIGPRSSVQRHVGS